MAPARAHFGGFPSFARVNKMTLCITFVCRHCKPMGARL